jgi:integrase
VSDVDFLRKSLTVARQVQRVNSGAIGIRAPKYGFERVVYLADSLVELIAQHIARFGTHGEKRWLFAGDGGNAPHQNSVGCWWRKTLRGAGLSDVKLHDLRHFYASGLIAAGCDVVTVQRSLGHAKATTTLNTYAHLWPTAEDRTRNAAQSIMAASLGQVPAPELASYPEFLRTKCGLATFDPALTRQNAQIHTLKRNSTTSPSCIT